ncbi:Calmodulin-3 [Phlyctochytrium planicorne]|nr:Calmodulin-3 [Phlyctochytrium planicorne]
MAPNNAKAPAPGSASAGASLAPPRSSMNKGSKKVSRVTINEPVPEIKSPLPPKGGPADHDASYLQIDPSLKDRTGLKEEELHELIEIFSLVDVDHGGTISTDELAALMRTLGLKASQDELDAIVKELDTQGSGEIDFELTLNVAFVVGMSRKVQTNLTSEELLTSFKE